MKYIKTSFIILIITITSILLGFMRESVVVCKLGVSWQADSFNFAILLPSFLFATMGGVISTTFMPLYTDIRINKSIKEANHFASTFTNYILIICASLVVVGEIFPGFIVKFLAPGFNGDTYILTVDLVRIVLPSLFFLGITYCLIGVLESNKDMVLSSAITMPMHLSIMISLILVYPKLGFKYTMLIVVLGSIIQVLLVIIRLKKWEYRYYFSLKCENEYLKQAFNMIGPMILGIMALQINIMVDRMLASTLEAGSITSINLASKLNIASYSSVGYIVVLMIFPVLSEYQAKGDMLNYGKALNKGINLILMIMVPITIIMVFFSSEIVNILFGYGKFTQKDIIDTSEILIFYSIGISFLGMRDILNRGFYSLHDTITPMKNSIISIALNIVINLFLIKIFKAKGIAVSTTIAMALCSMLLFKNITQKVNSVSLKNIGSNLIKIIISSIGLFITIFIVKKLFIMNSIDTSFKFNMIVYVSVSSFAGILVYLIFLVFLKVEGFKEIQEKIYLKFSLLKREI